MDSKQVEDLRRLKTLLNEGIITREEFNEARDNILHPTSTESHAAPSSSDNQADDNSNNADELVIKEKSHSQPSISPEKPSETNGDISKQPNNTGKDNFSRILIAAIGVVIVIGAIWIVLNYLGEKKVTEDLIGEWEYSGESYKRDTDGSYDAQLDSTITFADNGVVNIRIDNCVCTGEWEVSKAGDTYYIYVINETKSGSSNNLDQLVENLSYKEFDDGINLYWYNWDGEHATDWHYYKKNSAPLEEIKDAIKSL